MGLPWKKRRSVFVHDVERITEEENQEEQYYALLKGTVEKIDEIDSKSKDPKAVWWNDMINVRRYLVKKVGHV